MFKKDKYKNAIVVEGGGMRGIFAAGVLDHFYDMHFDPFDVYYGVSAGACNLASHLGRQYGRNYRCYTKYMQMPQFFSKSRFVRGGHYMDLDWLWSYLEENETLNVGEASKKHFYVTLTDVQTGKPVYMRANPITLADYLKASSSLPLMYRGFVHVEGRLYSDGGITDSIPVEQAARYGAKKILVIRSRTENYRKKSFVESRLMPLLFRRYPALKRAMKMRQENYNRALDFIENPPKGVRIIEICPYNLFSGRTTNDIRALNDDYKEGLRAGRRAIDRWREII